MKLIDQAKRAVRTEEFTNDFKAIFGDTDLSKTEPKFICSTVIERFFEMYGIYLDPWNRQYLYKLPLPEKQKMMAL